MAFKVAGVVATASEVAARVRLVRIKVRVVGLSRLPPLAFMPHHGAFGVSSRSGVPADETSIGTAFGPCPLLRRRACLLGGRRPGRLPWSGRDRSACPGMTSTAACLAARCSPTLCVRPGSSLGVVQRSPLHRHQRVASTPGRGPSQARSRALRPGLATSRARSVLAVLHDFDGLLRIPPCRLVASCCRPWGSPRFRRWLRCCSRAWSWVLGPRCRHRCLGSRPADPPVGGSTRQPPPSPGCCCRTPGSPCSTLAPLVPQRRRLPVSAAFSRVRLWCSARLRPSRPRGRPVAPSRSPVRRLAAWGGGPGCAPGALPFP